MSWKAIAATFAFLAIAAWVAAGESWPTFSIDVQCNPGVYGNGKMICSGTISPY